ncbi:MAG: phospho-sugar mutase [Clostridia bacterium]|nr:phospho-sugar mutase [Clostridia bacterium]
MRDVNELYRIWSENAFEDPDLALELADIEGDAEKISDRFYMDLSFGTAGLRGVIGAGTNRMNVYTVGRAAQGLADYLNADFDSPSVAIGYDSRIKSRLFAETAAGVLAANGIKVYFYGDIAPTPLVSFAVRRYGASSGIVITASHNPSEYNGFKCYDAGGYQMTDAAADKTYGFIKNTDYFSGIKKVSFASAVNSGMVEFIDDDVKKEFLDSVLDQRIRPDLPKERPIKILYTPLNGTGNLYVREILRLCGHKNVRVVESQKLADGRFPTCPYPNPEIRQVFEEGIKQAESFPADLIIATDPDADRMGIAVRGRNGEYTLLTGNQVGILLTDYILGGLSGSGLMPEKPVVIKSIVTSDLVTDVCREYGAQCVELLTGFKYIGEYVTALEKDGRSGDFILGFEESYGYLRGSYVRDKDAVVASMLIAELACYASAKGMTLTEMLDSVYEHYGFCENKVVSFSFPGADGMENMKSIMAGLRSNAPKKIAGYDVLAVSDFIALTRTDASGEVTPLDYPVSDILIYELSPGKLIIRPSGTEPKLKIYIGAKGTGKAQAAELVEELLSGAKQLAGV